MTVGADSDRVVPIQVPAHFAQSALSARVFIVILDLLPVRQVGSSSKERVTAELPGKPLFIDCQPSSSSKDSLV